jgi:hypothetical protein
MNKSQVVLISALVLFFLCPNPLSAAPVQQDLVLGVPVAGSLSGTGDEQYYQVNVSAGQHLFVVLDSDSNYNAYDLYVKFGALPTTVDYDDEGDSPNADQAVEIAATQAGYYYVMIRSTSGGGNYTLVAHTNSTFPTLNLGMAGAGSLQGTYDVKYYQVPVAAGKPLFVILNGEDNNNTYELYIRFGSPPTTLDYDDKGDSTHADQEVKIAATKAGYYYVMVRSTSGGGNYTIRAQTVRCIIAVPLVLRNR